MRSVHSDVGPSVPTDALAARLSKKSTEVGEEFPLTCGVVAIEETGTGLWPWCSGVAASRSPLGRAVSIFVTVDDKIEYRLTAIGRRPTVATD